MAGRRILYIGGTGAISTSCVARSLARGDEVTVLNRGTGRRPIAEGAESVIGDIREPRSVRDALGDREFDAVAEFTAFTPEHVRTDLDLFGGRTGQYVFISSASAYQKPPRRLPITESTPLRNPFWQYARDKIACEDLLVAAYRERGLPITIVRPSHTYDHTLFPNRGGWTDVVRLRAGKPVVIHGDGTSLWTLTHSDDFAVAFAALLANPLTIGEAFTITGDHVPTWNQIYSWLAEAAGAASPEFVHIASETIARIDPDQGPSLLGDKAHSAVFDNAKITALVPEFRTTITFDEGARRLIEHYDSHPDAQRFDPEGDAMTDRLIAAAGPDAAAARFAEPEG
ncbi:NAD-dependent epimerase/dehydratase family protein [Microbacterium rhizomatis]|uniref:NAD-dependent epimerase/dehydratase family protein n=1 Tax=Microbacterium rhizomatis TaxID=1631477 RepID=A0A5J5IXQ6_9MICO|nr:NAD-dependent epimerase/dehydratase family protein [Microbacterium rhizomatis]KAA9105648.1 NAD-dependent epimerase/dehydratase family protein [Microbacterium rhizomatis]